MSHTWIHENPPRWDAAKKTIIGGAPDGIFTMPAFSDGDLLPGEWWRIENDGQVVGYGWLDAVWGDAEILLAVAPDGRGRGVGTYILEQLEREASSRGLRYLYNVVRETHPDGDAVKAWLEKRRFEKAHDHDRLRRLVPAPGGSLDGRPR